MPPVTRGARHHLVSLEQPGPPLPDGHGGFTATYVALDPPTMYAAIAPSSAADMERSRADTSLAVATHLVTMDFHPQVSTQTRLVVPEGRVLHVTGVRSPDFRGIDLELSCTEVVP